MKKLVVVGIVLMGILSLGAIGSHNQQQSPSLNSAQNVKASTTAKTSPASKTEKITPTCDGTAVTNNCQVDGITYTTYIYHPAVVAKTHTETVTSYVQKVSGYCTLCVDNTYSPSCATGRGACSHHGGVAQWNAPEYSSVPQYSTKTVVDTPAQEAYYEKLVQIQ